LSPNLHSPLRLNVGFIVNQNVGYSRSFPVEVPRIHIEPDLDLGELSGVIRVTRTPQGLLVQVKLQARILSECVRCLQDFTQNLQVDFTDLYAFNRRSMADADLLLPEDMHIVLDPLVREYMLLDVPIGPLCRPDCKGLCPICGENLNEVACDHTQDSGDPRLSVLKSLLEEDQEENSEEDSE
jgi:uncharacterized protein